MFHTFSFHIVTPQLLSYVKDITTLCLRYVDISCLDTCRLALYSNAPFSTYGENAGLFAQNVVILQGFRLYSKNPQDKRFCQLLSLVLALFPMLLRSPLVLHTLQSLSIPLLSISRLMQVAAVVLFDRFACAVYTQYFIHA